MTNGIIQLSWHGPLKLGNLPETDVELARLGCAGVYILFRHYTQRPLVYAGKADNLAKRFATHITETISGKTGELFDNEGVVLRVGGLAALFRSLQKNREDTLHRGVEDALRTRFIYTLLPDKDLRKSVEATIIGRLLENPPASFKVWNYMRHRTLETPAVLEHEYSDVDMGILTKEEQQHIQTILQACRIPT